MIQLPKASVGTKLPFPSVLLLWSAGCLSLEMNQPVTRTKVFVVVVLLLLRSQCCGEGDEAKRGKDPQVNMFAV